MSVPVQYAPAHSPPPAGWTSRKLCAILMWSRTSAQDVPGGTRPIEGGSLSS